MNETTIPKFEIVREEALRFLRDNKTAVVATTFDGKPDASTVNYLADEDDFTIYFMTQVNTSKYANLSHNDHVAVVIGTGPEHITLKIFGTAKRLKVKEQSDIFERLVALVYSEGPIRDMARFKDVKVSIFKVSPEKVVFMNLDDKNYSASISDRFVNIFPYAQQY